VGADARVERLADGCVWAEATAAVSVFRAPSHYAVLLAVNGAGR
jgi:hypothetical protein